jgi:spermidine/putrescine transport system ATP-binding protein
VDAAARSGAPVVAFEGVTKRYPKAAALAVAGVDLGIQQGEFFSLLGPSGSGKTSCLRMIAGFEHPTTGRVLLDGTDVSGVPPYRRDVNTVFQNYALFPHMTVEQNVAYPLRMTHVPRAQVPGRVASTLATVDMSGFEKRLPHQLSGGQRQRIALARALVGRPKVLLLDEPLGALDLKLRQQMQLALKRLQREVGITFIYVTHDQGEALAMSDRLAVMSAGRIEQVGSPREVYYAPATPFVANFIGKTNLLRATVRRDGETVVADCDGGLAIPLAAPSPDGPCTLSLRYESVRIGEPTGPDQLRFDATVDDVVFLGDSSEVISSVHGTRVVARHMGHGVGTVRPGDTLVISFSPADLVRVGG